MRAAKVLTALLINADEQTYNSFDPSDLFTWISNKLLDSNANVVDTVVQILQSLLSFYKHGAGVANLVALLNKNNQSAQMQYQVVYCLWLMTFIEEVADLQRKHNVLPLLIEIAKSAIKEKVVRVVFSTIRQSPQENLVALLGNKVLAICETLSTRKWSDSEITDDLEYLKEELGHRVQSLSTWDEYNTEGFWKQNAAKLAEKDYELVKMISRLISTTTSTVVLSVAAHDLGQFVKHYPSGKRFIQEVERDVRYQALLAVQKFMTNAWDY
ncbi:armadillo-type protein [Chytridium lagenaria]|nr:armadillo-type protein [Chytridium lagenaria]